MTDVLVRDARPPDHVDIRAVVIAAFGRPGEANLVDQLRADGDLVIELVAVEGDRLVGHVLFSRVTAPFGALGLAPVSVIPDRQGLGVGSCLIRAGLDRAAREGWQGVFVLGEPDFYRRFGFDPALAKDFTSPYAGPHLMARALGEALPATKGQIHYAPAFRRLA